MEVPTHLRLNCFERRPNHQNSRTRASTSVFDTLKFGAVSHSALTHTRDSKQGYQNEDVSRVGGMITSADIGNSIPFSDSEMAPLMVLFRFDVSSRQHFLQCMQCHMGANTSGRDSRLSYWTLVGELPYNCENTQLHVAFSSYISSAIDASPT